MKKWLLPFLLLAGPAFAEDVDLDYSIQTPQMGFTEQASDRPCNVGDYWIASNSTLTKLRKCENGVIGDVGDGGGGGASDSEDLTNTPGDPSETDPGDTDDMLDMLSERTRFALASNNMDAIADLNTQTLWRRTKTNGPMTRTSFAGNSCRAMQEALNYALTVTAPVDSHYDIGWFGEDTMQVATDTYDQGPGTGCIFAIPTSSAPGTGGTGGYSVNDANREGWPEVDTTVVGSGMNARTATGGGASTLSDTDGSTLANEAGKFVEITGGTGTGQRRKISIATATQLTVDLAWATQPDATSVYRVFSIPALVSGTITVHEDYVLTIDQTGQTKSFEYLTRGNGYVAGYDGNTNGFAGSIAGLNFTGRSTLIYTNEVATPGWLAGQMPEASVTNIVTPSRASISYFDYGYRRAEDSTSRTITCLGAASNDNIAYYTSQTWGLQRSGKGTIQCVGLAVKYHDNNATRWASQYVSSVHYGISVGEVPFGGDSVPRTGCLSGYCDPVYTGGAAGLFFDDWITESCDFGCWTHVDGGMEVYSNHTEAGVPVNNHYVLIGAVKCDGGNAATAGRYVGRAALNGDCGSGGSGILHATGPVTQVNFSGDGFFPTVNSHTLAGIMIGDGANQSKGMVYVGPGMRFGNETVPANDPSCTGPATPHFYCTAAGANPTIQLHGPRFAPGAAVRVVLDNAMRLAGEPVTTSILWPYLYYKFPDTHVVEFVCRSCDINVNDVIGRDGGFIPDGMTGQTLDEYGFMLYPHHFFGNQTFTNIYFQKMICTWDGGNKDGTEVESISVRLFLYDSNSAPVPIGSAISLTEGVDAASSPKGVNISTNTEHFDFASGTPKDYTGVFSLGLYVSAEVDATDNNLIDLRCGARYATLGDE